jgi:hypothetical protein
MGSNAPSFAAQVPLTQPTVAGHDLPQPPQLLGSLLSSTQPAVQQVLGAAQAGPPLQPMGATQALATHVSPGGHALPQPPQFLGSLVSLTHPARQHVSAPVQAGPPLHVARQVDITQLSPGGQTMPQPPQFSRLLVVSTQSGEQQVSPPVHA